MLTYEEQKALYNLKAFPALLKKTSQKPHRQLKKPKVQKSAAHMWLFTHAGQQKPTKIKGKTFNFPQNALAEPFLNKNFSFLIKWQAKLRTKKLWSRKTRGSNRQVLRSEILGAGESERWRIPEIPAPSSRPASHNKAQLVKGKRALLNQRATKSKSQSAAHKSCIIICLFGLLISWAPKPRSQFPVTQWGTVEVVAEELTSK